MIAIARPLFILEIEVDGHHHGGPPIKPWVARITGTDPKFGLAREFVQPKNDYANARSAWSGRVYGMVATFALREGSLYEIAQADGSSSKRHIARRFAWIEAGVEQRIEPLDALAMAEGTRGQKASVLKLPDDPEGSWVDEQMHDCSSERIGFVVVDGARLYRLHEGHLYDVHQTIRGVERNMFMTVRDGRRVGLTERDAARFLEASAAP